MGTRGSIGIILEEKYTGIYNHFDSYPESLGEQVVAFVKETNKTKTGWDKLKSNMQKVEVIQHGQEPTDEQIEKYKEYSDLSVSNQSYKDWYCLLRKIQGVETLREIMKGKLFHISPANDFIKDSLFCEYAYIINLDDMTIEFYVGYQHEPQEGNRFGIEPDKESAERNPNDKSSWYYPCKMVGKCPLKKIPKEWISKFYQEEKEEA